MNVFTRILVYDATYVVGFVLMLSLSLLTHGLYKSSRLRAAAYSFITFFSGLAGAFIIGFLYNVILSLKDIKTDVRVDVLGAVIFTSLFLLAAVYAEKGLLRLRAKKSGEDIPPRAVSFRDTMDMMIPGSFLVFASIKFGCSIRGCCFGVECSWGVHALNDPNVTLFPVQLFECATLLLILLTCYFIKRTPFFRRGMAGPLAANLYGLSRFFWEILRYNPPELRHFALGMTVWQVFCVLVLIVSVIWLGVLYKTQPSEPLPKSRLHTWAEMKLKGGKKKKPAANKPYGAVHGGKKKTPAGRDKKRRG